MERYEGKCDKHILGPTPFTIKGLDESEDGYNGISPMASESVKLHVISGPLIQFKARCYTILIYCNSLLIISGESNMGPYCSTT